MVQIGPLISEAVYEKSMGHFDPLIGRGMVWVVFIHATFLFVVLVAETRTGIFEHLKISGRNSPTEIREVWARRAHTSDY